MNSELNKTKTIMLNNYTNYDFQRFFVKIYQIDILYRYIG